MLGILTRHRSQGDVFILNLNDNNNTTVKNSRVLRRQSIGKN